jgi:AcrR family transcriptional regulator
MEVGETGRAGERQQRGVLSAAGIARAGIQLADAEGLDAVSMRRVAARLGSGTMSLYRHVSSRDDLLALMTDEVFSGVPELARSGRWREDLTAVAALIRDVTLRHPWLAGRSVPRLGLGPNLLRMLESTLAVVDGHGLSVDQSVDVLGTLRAFVQGCIQEEVAEQDARRRTTLTKTEVQRSQEAEIRRIVDSGAYPHVSRVVIESAEDADARAVFDRRLAHVLDGLAPVFG